MRVGNKIIIKILEDDKKKNATENTLSLAEPIERTYIEESGELGFNSLFDDVNENNLISKMDYNSSAKMYYKVITSVNDYETYNKFFKLPEMNIQNFENYFIVILVNDSERAIDETDLQITKVIADGPSTFVIMKQKNPASAFQLNNIFYAVVEKTQLTNDLIIEIEK